MLWGTNTPSHHSSVPAGFGQHRSAHNGLVPPERHIKNRPAHKHGSRKGYQGGMCTALDRHAGEAHDLQPRAVPIERRSLLVTLASAAALYKKLPEAQAAAEEASHVSEASQPGPTAISARLTTPDYTAAGPLLSSAFPNLEHTCSRCFPACVGNRCMLRLGVFFPRDGRSKGTISAPLQCPSPAFPCVLLSRRMQPLVSVPEDRNMSCSGALLVFVTGVTSPCASVSEGALGTADQEHPS